MRVAIDCTAAVNQSAGIGRFVRGLIGGLAEIDSQNQYLLVHAAPNGTVAYYYQNLNPDKHVERMLNALKALPKTTAKR